MQKEKIFSTIKRFRSAMISKYYKDLMSMEDMEEKPYEYFQELETRDTIHMERLDSDITEEEINSVLFDICDNKAPMAIIPNSLSNVGAVLEGIF
ncbi:hypothetical protein FRX31_004512 [Thalictrum thalictroides]|uniref:Uncharacterized protein n=1 Tax=Thalictrum thalictroides TaxID=46969 RepID=A0A7J6XBR7_THATH|nr:hypothetical protein FRX31_004512 [Thalictrum thalictroides]